MNEQEKVMTFPMLCQIKREQLGLGVVETAKKIPYSNYNYFERGLSKPTPKFKHRIIKFFRITDQELSQCKDAAVAPAPMKTRGLITDAIRLLDEIIDKTKELKLDGALGDTIASTALSNIELARTSIADVKVLERLLG